MSALTRAAPRAVAFFDIGKGRFCPFFVFDFLDTLWAPGRGTMLDLYRGHFRPFFKRM